MSNIVSQRDPQWGNIKLGTSNVNISGYGCTITCLGYLVGLTPDKVNERMNTVGGYSNGNLVIWTKVQEAIGVTCYRYTTYDNTKVTEAITSNGACLGEVDASAIGGTGKHWVVMTGNKKVQDPWTGVERPTSDFTFTGFTTVIFDRTKMGNYTLEVVVDPKITALESELNEKRQQISNYDQQVAGLLGEKKQLVKQIEDLNSQLGSVRGELASSLAKIDSQNKTILSYVNEDAVQLETLKRLEGETNEYKNKYFSLLNDFQFELKLAKTTDGTPEELKDAIDALGGLIDTNESYISKVKQLNIDISDLIAKNEELVKQIQTLKSAKLPIDKQSIKSIIIYLLQRLTKGT